MAQSPYKFCAPASVFPKREMGERGAWGGRETGREEETDQEDPKLRKCAKQIFKKRLFENTRLSKHTKQIIEDFFREFLFSNKDSRKTQDSLNTQKQNRPATPCDSSARRR
jgi:hypothetical protein